MAITMKDMMARTGLTEQQVQSVLIQLASEVLRTSTKLSASQITIICTPPRAGGDCWFKAIMHLLTTQDIIGALVLLFQCLLTSGTKSLDGAMGCLYKFFVAIFGGTDFFAALVGLWQCLLDDPTPPPPPPDGEIPEYTTGPSGRCG